VRFIIFHSCLAVLAVAPFWILTLACAIFQGLIDQLVPVSGPESIATSLALAQKEGIFTGISGGASMAAALKIAETAPEGSTILAMCADTAERYLSTPLFADIEADMNDAEKEISASTPNFHLPE
jgi:cysteine synthase A